MDEQLGQLADDTDAEFREAVHWWIRLRECGSEREALLGFEHWLAGSSAHRRAFASMEALWDSVGQVSQGSRRYRPSREADT